MRRVYLGGARALARAATPLIIPGLLRGWGLPRICTFVAARCTAALIGFTIASSVLTAPAQLSPQSIERTLIQHDARIRALERGQAEMVSTLTRVTEQGSQLNRLSEQVAVLSNQIAERDKFLAWLLAMINSVAVIAAGVAWMIRHRKQQN